MSRTGLNTIILVCSFALLSGSCGQRGKNQTENNTASDKTNTIPDKSTVKAVNQKEEVRNEEQLIEQIRAEYAAIVANKGKYIPKVCMEYEENLDGGGRIKRYVTMYYDKDENIRLIVYTENHYGDDGSAFTVNENYLKDKHLFFAYQREKTDHTPACPNGECYTTTITEKRVYYDNYKCFKYLFKQVSGKYSEASALEKLLKKKPNIEMDCESVELFDYE